MPFPNTLTIAGFDGSGGAGLQADLKTFSALGCYGTTVLTALPVQNTQGVRAIYDIPVKCVQEQLQAIVDDIPIHAIKVGMVQRREIIEAIAPLLTGPLVLDPVMVAKSGDFLLQPDAVQAMRERLFPLAILITPNLPEASTLLGRPISTRSQMEKAAQELLKLGPQAVLLKGGHLEENCDDCFCTKNELHWLCQKRIETQNTHGTGCTLSAAIAAFLAHGSSLLQAVTQAKDYLTKALIAGASLKIGKGKGPVHHFYHIF